METVQSLESSGGKYPDSYNVGAGKRTAEGSRRDMPTPPMTTCTRLALCLPAEPRELEASKLSSCPVVLELQEVLGRRELAPGHQGEGY